MASVVYLLCAGTALFCCALLLRAHLRNRAPLLFWSGLCFAALTFDNLFLFIDRTLLPQMDLSNQRAPVALVAVAMLLYGLIWNTNRV